MSQRSEGADELLARLRRAVEDEALTSDDLRSEYERWRVRFELLEARVSCRW